MICYRNNEPNLLIRFVSFVGTPSSLFTHRDYMFEIKHLCTVFVKDGWMAGWMNCVWF